uniref:Uncharacterized protein n=1 Tax=Stomoxys calcitrans TaxID=35570 RepID=A0A1I8NUN6_STOCA
MDNGQVLHSVKREIPQFIQNYIASAECLIDAYKRKTCLVLTKNLKLFEFHQKQLMASIDLTKTCLNSVKKELGDNGYSSQYPTASDSSSTDYTKVCIGKYVRHSITLIKVYIIVRCWDKCIILLRLPNFKGFEVKAEYKDIQDFRITHGHIKFCPVLQLEFKDGTIKSTDFEEDSDAQTDISDFVDKKAEFKLLLERVRSAKTELKLHETVTGHSFERLQNKLTYGLPYTRSLKLEEKQMLARCGDVWKRLTPQNELVIGVSLVNQCASPNLTVLQNIQPTLQVGSSSTSSVVIQYRLFQLKQLFNQLDSVDTFLQSEDEQMQANVWSSDCKCKLLPESYVIFVMKIKLSDIISLSDAPLLLHYEVLKDCYSTKTTTQLQIYLETIDFDKILFKQRPMYELYFQPPTLHQDFLSIAISSHETNLNITFEQPKDLEIFEKCLQQKFDFQKLPSFAEETLNHSVYYNNFRNSLWFGCLCLRYAEIEENEHDNLITSWKLYCPDKDKVLLFLKMLFHDLLTLQSNLVSIENGNKNMSQHAIVVAEFENALREELYNFKQFLSEAKIVDKFSNSFINVGKAQRKSDYLYQNLKHKETSINVE